MESHILNMYHQPRFRSIGHKLLRSTSDSLSSESSCQQNSPEYNQEQQTNQYEVESNEGEYWDPQENQGQVWNDSNNENCVTEQSSHDSSSEDDNDVEESDAGLDRTALDVSHIEQLSIGNVDNYSLVEGADYDVIQVYAVHPDFDLEASSDEDEENDYCLQENTEESDSEEIPDTGHMQQEKTNSFVNNYDYIKRETSDESHDDLGITLDTPVVSNVDEYFIKDTKDKNILDIKDEPIVHDVDEYFVKETKPVINTPTVAEHEQNISSISNVDDFFVKKESTVSPFHIPKVTPIMTDMFEEPQSSKDEVKHDETSRQDAHEEVPIAETVLDMRGNHVPRFFSNVDDIKKFLFADISDSKYKHAQKSCSVPHSPMHSICLDLDAKTSMSFEDLNIDLSDLNDSDKDKSANSSKGDDIPITLTDEDVNSFLITNKAPQSNIVKTGDDFSTQDMEIDGSIDTDMGNIDNVSPMKLDRNKLSTPIPNVLEFCIEKSPVKKEFKLKAELEDFVDVESCNEIAIPIFEANRMKSQLDKKIVENNNTKAKKSMIKINEHKVKPYNTLTNGMRLQDAGVQLNKNKMRKIMMPTSINTAVRRSPSPVRSDHDYCSSKKRYDVSLKRGQSLLKPEVLSSNNRILNSRHRSCKNKKVIYHLSSDDESEKCKSTKMKKAPSGRSGEDNDVKIKKSVVKQPVKVTVPSTCRKKTSPEHSAPNDRCFDKGNDSVMVKNACKASDNPSSQSSNGSIKLTIKNKSEVIIKNCDDIKDYKKDRKTEKSKSLNIVSDNATVRPIVKVIETVASNKNDIVNTVHVHSTSVSVKEENSKPEHFYTALFSNKQDVLIPNTIHIKSEKRSHEEDLTQLTLGEDIITKIEMEQPQKKKKLNLQEYKLRRGGSSNNSSATVSPESIFPDMPIPDSIVKVVKSSASQTPTNAYLNTPKIELEAPKKVFDPIMEASRKIPLNSKKQKAEAMRKRDEDIVMSKIPKVENLELQPLISEAEMMKIVGMVSATDILPAPIVVENLPPLSDYDEIVVVSIGTNTDEEVFKRIEQETEHEKKKLQTPLNDMKSTINFKIKKPDHVLKHNIFDTLQKDKSSLEENKVSDLKINQDRYKDITATLKSVEKQVETKISSNSLFASIQDVVMKKAPDATVSAATNGEHKDRFNSSLEKKNIFKAPRTLIIREYDVDAEHGEDKIILHLEKQRIKPSALSIAIQTNPVQKIVKKPKMPTPEKVTISKNEQSTNRKRNDSDMSMSSESSPDRKKTEIKTAKVDEKSNIKSKHDKRETGAAHTKEKRSNSRERYEFKYRRSRSTSRGHRRKHSPSRNRSRSRSRYRRYRRSDSPYRRKRRSRTRSPYRKRRSPTPRREYRHRSRSRSKHAEPKRSKSPVKKIRPSPQYESNVVDKKTIVSLTPPPLIRKPTVSESSESSASSSSSSTSSSTSSSEDSVNSSGSSGSFDKEKTYNMNNYRSFSPDDVESSTSVEERRVVFVGTLEKDLTKAALRAMFLKFGPITEIKIHTKDDGSRYGFVTYRKCRDAWAAVEAANTFPQYDIGFGGRRDFCRQSYSDLDGLEAQYSESAFLGQTALPTRSDDMSFEQMLLDVKKKLSQRKCDKKRHDDIVD